MKVNIIEFRDREGNVVNQMSLKEFNADTYKELSKTCRAYGRTVDR